MICVHTCMCVCHRGTGVNHGKNPCCDGKCELCKSPISLGQMEDHLTSCHKVKAVVLDGPAAAQKEFSEGVKDGKAGKECRLLGLRYFNGYIQGKRVRVLHERLKSIQR